MSKIEQLKEDVLLEAEKFLEPIKKIPSTFNSGRDNLMPGISGRDLDYLLEM